MTDEELDYLKSRLSRGFGVEVRPIWLNASYARRSDGSEPASALTSIYGG
jgi:hypothetical protein